jgi:hypothetical protein
VLPNAPGQLVPCGSPASSRIVSELLWWLITNGLSFTGAA